MIADASKIFPAWRTVRCEFLGQFVQVRRPTIGDIQLPVAEMWARLVRDADGSPLFASSYHATDADPKLVEEICTLATATPTDAAG